LHTSRWLLAFPLILGTVATCELAAAPRWTRAAQAQTDFRSVTAALDSLQVVGQFEYAPHILVAFGDTDHDGWNEIILATQTPTFEGILRILEYEEDGEIRLVFEGPYLIPLATGDLDQDGRSDLIGQVGASLVVYESVDEYSHPTTLVWQSPGISSQVGYSEIADTDSDGRLEIVHHFFAGAMQFVIFECQGDNSYVQKFLSAPQNLILSSSGEAFVQSTYSPWLGDDLVFDLDEDGRPEIASGGLQGRLQIFESPADDVWERIFTDSTGLIASRIVSGGVDTDGDGKQELFLGGDDPNTFERKVFIYQPDGDQSFVRAATLAAFDNASGTMSGAMARLEPAGTVRFVWQIYQQLRLYSAATPGQWDLESVIPEPSTSHNAVYARDLNRNGRDEIYWISNNRTVSSLILERPMLPTDVSGGIRELGAALLRVAPSPCWGDATVFLDVAIASRAAEWSAFDAAGRLVFQRGMQCGTPRQAWAMPVLRPGIYFLRVTDGLGRPLATGRATVIR